MPYMNENPQFDISFITNFSNTDEQLYLAAIAAYKKKYPNTEGDLYIENTAYDIYGNFLPGDKSLHTTRREDLSKFWIIFDELKPIFRESN